MNLPEDTYTLQKLVTLDRLAASARHVTVAHREEAALERKLDTGRFGAESAGRPWPAHDAALCRDYAREAERSWFFATRLLLEVLLSGGES